MCAACVGVFSSLHVPLWHDVLYRRACLHVLTSHARGHPLGVWMYMNQSLCACVASSCRGGVASVECVCKHHDPDTCVSRHRFQRAHVQCPCGKVPYVTVWPLPRRAFQPCVQAVVCFTFVGTYSRVSHADFRVCVACCLSTARGPTACLCASGAALQVPFRMAACHQLALVQITQRCRPPLLTPCPPFQPPACP